MSNVFTLDELRAETKRRFDPIVVEIDENTSMELRALIRLGEKDREAVADALEDLKNFEVESEDEVDETEAELVIDTMKRVFALAGKNTDKFFDAIAEEEALVRLSILTDVLNAWIGATQPGEA